MDAETLKTIFVELAKGGLNASIARRVGCDRRTVRRYRRLVRALDVAVRDLDDLSGESLRQILNSRSPLHDEPDFAGLHREFPGKTARFRYDRYRERQLAAGHQAMSLAHFNRLRAEYEFRSAGVVRFAPAMPRLSASTLQRWSP